MSSRNPYYAGVKLGRDRKKVRNKPNPDEPCAPYRHFDAAGRLLYVGIAIDPPFRQRHHLQWASWRNDIATITVGSGTV
jgi:hypothetical protein